jgi:hypothetical protein
LRFPRERRAGGEDDWGDGQVNGGLGDDSVWQGDVKYNLACHYPLLGAKAKAIRELQESLVLNPGLIDWSKEDPDLDAIWGEPEYQAIYEN